MRTDRRIYGRASALPLHVILATIPAPRGYRSRTAALCTSCASLRYLTVQHHTCERRSTPTALSWVKWFAITPTPLLGAGNQQHALLAL